MRGRVDTPRRGTSYYMDTANAPHPCPFPPRCRVGERGSEAPSQVPPINAGVGLGLLVDAPEPLPLGSPLPPRAQGSDRVGLGVGVFGSDRAEAKDPRSLQATAFSRTVLPNIARTSAAGRGALKKKPCTSVQPSR